MELRVIKNTYSDAGVDGVVIAAETTAEDDEDDVWAEDGTGVTVRRRLSFTKKSTRQRGRTVIPVSLDRREATADTLLIAK